jgi:endonuclease YncB( thermonuclease family)
VARRQRFLPRIVRDGLFLLGFFFLLILIAAKLDQSADETVRGPFYAIDGDTLSADGERLRLQGIDAPELDQTCTDEHQRTWACGQEAKRLLARMVADPGAECLGRSRDKYHRLLVRCHAGTTNINGAMVRRGLAVASGRYSEEQVAARREHAGLWAGTFENPKNYRASRGMMEDSDLVVSMMDWLKSMMGVTND